MKKTAFLCLSLALMTTLAIGQSKKMSNKKLVVTALTELFINRNVAVLDKYWSKNYVQHNPTIPNGSEHLKGMFGHLPANFKYEIGMVVAEGDLVMVHGRYTGYGPKPMVAVDIFRIKDGKLAEHWDVLQDEVPASNTASKNAMFSEN